MVYFALRSNSIRLRSDLWSYELNFHNAHNLGVCDLPKFIGWWSNNLAFTQKALFYSGRTACLDFENTLSLLLNKFYLIYFDFQDKTNGKGCYFRCAL